MAAPALVPVQRTIIKWENGLPIMAVEPVLTRGHVQSLYLIAAAQPYEVTDPLDPDFGLYDGMTIAEVLVRKQLLKAAQSGDAEQVMDRLIGKPMSRGENVNVNLGGTYEDYLKGLAAKAGGNVPPDSPPAFVEAQVVVDPSVFGDLA